MTLLILSSAPSCYCTFAITLGCVFESSIDSPSSEFNAPSQFPFLSQHYVPSPLLPSLKMLMDSTYGRLLRRESKSTDDIMV